MGFYGIDVSEDKVSFIDGSPETVIHLTNACLMQRSKKKDARIILQICDPDDPAAESNSIALGVLCAAKAVENLTLNILVNSRMGLRLAGPGSAGATVHVVGNELFPDDEDSDYEDGEEGIELPSGIIDVNMLVNNGQIVLASDGDEGEDEDPDDSEDVDMVSGADVGMRTNGAGKEKGAGSGDGSKDGKLVVKSKKGALPIILHESGLKFQDIIIGSGKKVVKGHNVAIQYVLRLENGKVVDRAERKRPFKFRLGIGECVKGFDIGVMGMREGGERHLIVPPNLGYGDQSPPGIPRNSTLYFDVSVVKAF